MSKREEQVDGDHYRVLGPHQPLDIVGHIYGIRGKEAALMNLVLKYLLRDKAGIPRELDLEKAIDCIERLIELEAKRK